MIAIRHDRKRGCGWRKPGGLYLVCEGEGKFCGKLPIPLERCPTCNGGIKPARGWTWVDAVALLRSVRCRLWPDGCLDCPANIQDAIAAKAGLLWIGEAFYPTPQDWQREAREQGISRRIPALPLGFKLGETWVLLAHRRVIPVTVEDGQAPRWAPGIFQLFKPSRVEYVVKGVETNVELADLMERGITPVRVVREGELDFRLPQQEGAT